ncbi:MAG: ferredoxin [Mycobacterium sp.]|nr:ferredoxin [Mycobacterium sp.]
MTARNGKSTLRVDPIACHAHGLCAELLPEMITLDEWGYPLTQRIPIPDALSRDARRAAAACPTLALRLDRQQSAGAHPAQRGRNESSNRVSAG